MDTPSGYSTPGDVRQRRSLWHRLKTRNENLHELTEDGSDFTLIRGRVLGQLANIRVVGSGTMGGGGIAQTFASSGYGVIRVWRDNA